MNNATFEILSDVSAYRCEFVIVSASALSHVGLTVGVVENRQNAIRDLAFFGGSRYQFSNVIPKAAVVDFTHRESEDLPEPSKVTVGRFALRVRVGKYRF